MTDPTIGLRKARDALAALSPLAESKEETIRFIEVILDAGMRALEAQANQLPEDPQQAREVRALTAEIFKLIAKRKKDLAQATKGRPTPKA